MDNANNISTNIISSSIKTPEAESEAPTRIQPLKPLVNGVLKRHLLHAPPPAAVVAYRECLKNHAAAMGGHAVDGCGEFMPSPSTDPSNPSSLKCAACSCHRNFHRRDPDDSSPPPPPPTAVIEYQPHHRHHPPPPQQRCGGSSPKSNSGSPPPISSSYMLLALSGRAGGHNNEAACPAVLPQQDSRVSSGRKRFRTKFTQGQKERMLQFAERVGWKMQRKDEEMIAGFCGEIGVDKGVFKVWMHNNKSTFGGKNNKGSSNGGFETTAAISSDNYGGHGQGNDNNGGGGAQAANGSSSSS